MYVKKSHDNDDEPKPSETKTIKQSTTDSQSGLFHKGEHEKCFAYITNTACDRHNFILDFEVGTDNIHASRIFDGLYEKLLVKFPEIQTIAVDAGYKTPWIMKQIIDSQRILAVPYKRPMTKDGFFKKYEYVYDEYYDCIICPNNQVLGYMKAIKNLKAIRLSARSATQFPSVRKVRISKKWYSAIYGKVTLS